MSSEPGTVTVENMGLGGVTVQLTGVSSASAVTDEGGAYAFTGLRMGNYSVEISGFDSDEVGFSATAASVTVGVGESRIVSFDGTYLRTAGIMGRVSVEGEGLEGVTVSLSGGPDAADMTTETDAAGQYSFAKLRAGDYAVGISGYNTDDYEFEVTSQSVTVALGETANVPFEGVLLRTSGISGRVSVEGMGLEGIMVMLSMGDEAADSAMTDVGGLYAFSGLAAGDYSVGIMVESEAYVFESMSMDVTVGDDETAIVNFEGMHARTASVSGMLFIDELMKNDTMDVGEAPLPHAGVPVVLVGPGVNDQMPSVTDSTGAYSFMGLRAGDYQLVVPVTEPMGDFAYGGSATGYALSVGVGEAVMQNLPIDITHTTVNVAVTLKGGDIRGMPVAGAMVTLYSDEDGEIMVGEGTTMADEETGHVYTSIRFPRAGTSDNTVHMGVSSDDYWVDPTAEMQALMWNPMSPVHPMPGAMPPAVLNDANILNLNVDVTVSGATVDRGDYGGGDALAGWAIGVMEGTDPTDLTPVTGDDVPVMLDDDGMATFTAELMPTDLPAAYHFGVAPDQDDDLDGGEMYEGTSVTHMHTGLTLAGNVEAEDMIEVTYTTQTLMVGVHHERDQVKGFTGNVLQGDMRAPAGMVDLEVRYIDGEGRSRSFMKDEWDAAKNTSFSKGVTTFTGVPADRKVLVRAEVGEDEDGEEHRIMLLDPNERVAYSDADRATGGLFGDNGGFSHTVELCPLEATEPQDHGECSAFAYVSTYSVSGLIWRRAVEMDTGDDFKAVEDPDFVAGTTIKLTPVEDKNLAGEDQSATTTARPVRTPGENSAGTSILDERVQFDFGDIATGAYTVTPDDGWRVRLGGKDTEDMVGNALNPLGGDVALDVTPATGTLYGHVKDKAGFAVEGATVDVNGQETTTDAHGRYIVEGFEKATGGSGSPTPSRYRRQDVVIVTVSMDEFDEETTYLFWSDEDGEEVAEDDANYTHTAMWSSNDKDTPVNNPTRYDIELAGVVDKVTITGKVTNILTGEGIGGVRILVDGKNPENLNAKNPPTRRTNNENHTAADGTYEAEIVTKARGITAEVSVSKKDYHFPVAMSPVLADGNSPAVVNFQAYEHGMISGTVAGPSGQAFAGVTVTATVAGAEEATATGMTNSVGQFSLSVPPVNTYTIAASMVGHRFSNPANNPTGSIFAGPGQSVNFGRITAMSFAARSLAVERDLDDDDNYLETATVTFVHDDLTDQDFGAHTYEYQTCTEDCAADDAEDATNWTQDVAFTDDPDEDDDPDTDPVEIEGTISVTDLDAAFSLRVVARATETLPDASTEDREIISDIVEVGAVDPTPEIDEDETERSEGATGSTDEGDELFTVTWEAPTNTRTAQRVVLQVEVSEGRMEWLVAEGGTPTIASDTRSWTLNITDFTAASWTLAEGGGTFNVTSAALQKAFMVRVEAVQGTASADNPWKASDAVEVPEAS